MISRSQDLHADFTLDEVKRIHERMAEAGVRSRSAYFRKMALDGYIVKLDMEEITEMVSLLRYSNNSLNQIAKKSMPPGLLMEPTLLQCKQDKMRSGSWPRRS